MSAHKIQSRFECRQSSIHKFVLICTCWHDLGSCFLKYHHNIIVVKGQLISKANCQAEDSPKKQTNEFVFTSMRHVFVRFLGESSAGKKNVSRLSDI